MQSTTVVVCVCPSRDSGPAGSPEGRARRAEALAAEEYEVEELGPGFGAPQRSHSITELRGMIYLRAREIVAPAIEGAARAATAAAVEGSGGGGAAARSQQLVVELFGRACRSVLRVDAQELVFEKCVVGSSSVKDFTIWNCSEVPLRFRLEAVMARQQQLAELEFTNLNTSMPVSEVGEAILGYSHARIRVHFKPRSAGQFSMLVEVINLNDARNVERLGVHALVTAHPQEEGLLLSGAGVLDFGDCYTSMPTRQLLSVRNISEHHLGAPARHPRRRLAAPAPPAPSPPPPLPLAPCLTIPVTPPRHPQPIPCVPTRRALVERRG